MKKSMLTAAVVFGLFGAVAWGDEIESAAKLLARITTPTTKPVDDKPTALKPAIESLAKTVATLPPDEAATKWLALVDRQAGSTRAAMMRSQSGDIEMVQFTEVAKALPGPAAWPALQTAMAKRPTPDKKNAQREALLRLFVAALQNDPAVVNAAIANVKSAMIDRGMPAPTAEQAVAKLTAALAGGEEDAKSQIDAFEAELVPGEGRDDINVPDLVTLAGAEKAEALLRKAVTLNRDLDINLGDSTKALARKIVTEQMDKLGRPQWNLVDSIDSVELYEAMIKKFPPPSTQPSARGGGLIGAMLGMGRSSRGNYDEHQYTRARAGQYYLLGLIAKGRTDDAMKVAKNFNGEENTFYVPSDGLAALDKAGLSKQVFAFLKQMVTQDPESPFWNAMLTVGAKAGASNEVLQIARDAAAKPDLSPAAKLKANTRLVDALLAADKIEEAVPQVRELQQLRAGTPGTIGEQLSLNVKLATLGRVTKQPALVKEGLDAANVQWAKVTPDMNLDSDTQDVWFREMIHADRMPEAVRLIGDQLAKAKENKDARQSYMYRNLASTRLIELADSYYRANKPEDVIVMLDQFPQWEAADLASISIYSGGHGAPKPIAFYAAWALAKTGKATEAKRILDHVLNERPGLDAAYEILLTLDPQPIAQLDALFARDQFEERPLIWKASVLRKQGKLDEAEKAARQAISIDPSDGEQGKGDRMRVYAVLADILADKGDVKNAQFFREVVAAIRLSEDADDAWNANLLSRAVAMYTEALDHFSEAYCIQSRLAARLAEMGMTEMAEQHYRKAYELMPDSFGRVESHCFGCEGAFNSEWAQAIAEQVFTKLLAKNPDKPQLHYLLGYLRQAQGRYVEALPAFRSAVKLDPQYLNAWKEILDTGRHIHLSSADSESAVLAIIQLDPLGRHGSPEVSKVKDLAMLWNAQAGVMKLQTAKPETLYPLKAAAVALAGDQNNQYMPHYGRSSDVRTPAEMVTSVNRLQVIMTLLDNGEDMDW